MKSAEQVYGLHAVAALLASRPASIKKLMVADVAADRQLAPLLAQAVAAGISIQRINRKQLDQQAPDSRHQGVIAVVRETTSGINERELPEFLAALTEPAFLLVLDGVQDPHNLGACLRTADAAGVHAVILPQDRAVGITPVVHKVACGAVESVPVFTVTNLARTLRQLRDAGIWIYGASDSAEQRLYDIDLLGPIALVLGSEGKGMRRLTREHCDYPLSIPMTGRLIA